MGEGPKITEGAPAPLFDRLVEAQDDSAAPVGTVRVLNTYSLIQSVRGELSRLLNTRCTVRRKNLAQRERTALEYGVSDFASLWTRSDPDQRALAQAITETITAYEPRLRDVRVTVEGKPAAESRVMVQVRANLVLGKIREAVSFSASGAGAEWSVEADGLE